VKLGKSFVGTLAFGAAVMLAPSAPTLADPPFWDNDDHPFVLAVVGDIACQPTGPVEKEPQKEVCDMTGQGSTILWQSQTATANQIEAMKPDRVLILGDEQYQVGRYTDFTGSFDHTYGAFKWLHRPAPGNHEFYSEHGESGVHGYGYFSYYNGYQVDPTTGNPVTTSVVAGDGGAPVVQPVPLPDGQAGQFGTNGDGWYSFDLGDWHIISLNIECNVQPGGCSPTGAWLAAETQWLANDLAHNHARCTLAYWHQPTFSAADTAVAGSKSTTAEGTAADTWWKLLYANGADVVLNGHDHLYARFIPLDPNANPDPRRGIREFIVGTGGETLDQPVPNATSQYIATATGYYWGVMKLTLHQDGYEWDYESAMKDPGSPPAAPANFSDAGKDHCHHAFDRF
jgi:Calcineurin-like phosphoesterase